MKNSLAKNLTNLFLVGITMLNFTIFSFGQEIEEIQIGEQIWMTTNLNVGKFKNGDSIPEAKTAVEWKKAGDNKQPAWCYYNFDSRNGEKYGKLYNWYAVNDPRGLAPEGWHVPTDLEWTKTTDFVLKDEDEKGESSRILILGKMFKNKNGWKEVGNGNNKSGFSGLPAGFVNSVGEFNFLGSNTFFWCYTESNSTTSYIRSLGLGLERYEGFKGNGYSVRCLKGNLPSIGEPGDF
jgi:uncharacterized protein (TIGR02145 family)